MAFLMVESGDLRGQRYEIGSNPVAVGRTEDNQIILNDAGVSSHHCHVLREGDLCKIVDLDSTNGTLLNGVPVKQSLLQDGDVVTVGPLAITYRSGESSSAEPPAVESPESSLPESPVLGSPAPIFKPRRRRNLALLPVILLLVTCVAAAAAFYLHRLFSY